jgi:thiol-disulfide isomerase/thioredoxin
MTSTGLIVAAAVLVVGTALGLWRRRTDGRLRSVSPGRAVRTPRSSAAGLASAASPAAGSVSSAAGLATAASPAVGSVNSMAGAVTAAPIPGSVDSGSGLGSPATSGSPAGAGGRDLGAGGTESGLGDSAGVGVGESSTLADGGVVIAGVPRPDQAASGADPADPSAAGVRLDAELLAALGVGPAQATLLQFSSAFCSPCRALRRVSSEVAELLPGVRHVEVDAESHLDAVRALGIWRTPTLLVLDADGRVAKRATGVPGKAQLIAVLGEILPAA